VDDLYRAAIDEVGRQPILFNGQVDEDSGGVAIKPVDQGHDFAGIRRRITDRRVPRPERRKRVDQPPTFFTLKRLESRRLVSGLAQQPG
jgi:hypothetical protein